MDNVINAYSNCAIVKNEKHVFKSYYTFPSIIKTYGTVGPILFIFSPKTAISYLFILIPTIENIVV